MRLPSIVKEKMKSIFRKKLFPRPVCQYSETEAHRYFVSRGIELDSKYGCGTRSEMNCLVRETMYYGVRETMYYGVRETMYYVCLNHRYRMVEWQQQTNPNLGIKWNSVWDLHNE
jgi:hypothetical protein